MQDHGARSRRAHMWSKGRRKILYECCAASGCCKRSNGRRQEERRRKEESERECFDAIQPHGTTRLETGLNKQTRRSGVPVHAYRLTDSVPQQWQID